VIVQDEATSVVWGMPGAAVATNHVDEVLPLERLGPTILALLGSKATPCN
jgi:two-component system chemotaxis response regulator CheB